MDWIDHNMDRINLWISGRLWYNGNNPRCNATGIVLKEIGAYFVFSGPLETMMSPPCVVLKRR